MRNARVLDDFKTNNDVRGGMDLTIPYTSTFSPDCMPAPPLI